MSREERRSFINNIEYIPYIQLDNEQKQMISDFAKDYDNLQSQLDIANKKLGKIKNHVQTQQSIIKSQPSADRSFDVYILARLNTILSIIGGE